MSPPPTNLSHGESKGMRTAVLGVRSPVDNLMMNVTFDKRDGTWPYRLMPV